VPRIIWIPWSGHDADEFVERSDQWNDVSPKNFTIITYQPDAASDVLQNLRKGKIYMRGHGMPGSPFVTTHGINLHIHSSIDRLIGMGLQPTFAGTIKFYSCYSAVDSVQKMRTDMVQEPKFKLGKIRLGRKFVTKEVDKSIFEGSRDCLARRGAAYFRSRLFHSCGFHGYEGPLSGKMEQKSDEELVSGHYHKHCLEIHFDEVGAAVSHPESAGRRASLARQDF
jgi:hypothetical protein